jgi:predicted CopG family antitoxin
LSPKKYETETNPPHAATKRKKGMSDVLKVVTTTAQDEEDEGIKWENNHATEQKKKQ